MAEFLEGRVKEFTIDEVQGTRCRLQRLSDLKFLSGWVREVGTKKLNVELKNDVLVEVGDRFNVEASINLATVGLPCVVTEVSKSNLTMEIVGEALLTTPGQEARYQAADITVSVHGGEKPIQAEAVDISANGLGILTYDPMSRFAKARLAVRGSSAAVECIGIVKYCRADTVEKDAFRIGFEIQFEDRLSKMMWLRLVQGASQATAKAA